MKTATPLTREQAINLLAWYQTEGASNFGTWSNYPNLPVGAQYLSYDVCRVHVQLDSPIEVKGNTYNCIATSRLPVGKKWDKPIGFNEIQDDFQISQREIDRCLAIGYGEKDLKRAEDKLKYHESLRKLKSAFILSPIQQIRKLSTSPEMSFTEPVGKVSIYHYLGEYLPDGKFKVVEVADKIELSIDTLAIWVSQGKCGNAKNRKRIYAPHVLPEEVDDQIQAAMDELKSRGMSEVDRKIEEAQNEVQQKRAILKLLQEMPV